MDAVIEPQEQREPELRLLTDLGSAGGGVRWREAAIASLAVHIGMWILLASLPEGVFKPPKRIVVVQRVTPLVAPPFELTQPDPNKGKISKSVNMESLLPHPSVQAPQSAPSTTRPAAKTAAPKPVPFEAPPAPAPRAIPAPQIAEPPKVETAMNEGALSRLPIGTPQALPAPPQIQTEEKPRLAFETQGAATSSPKQGTGRMAIPSSSVSEVVRTMPRGGSGGVTVGDTGSGLGGLGPGLNLPPAAGRAGSNLELLSDPQGVDFRPYMLKVLAAVRRNWFAIMPESAKLGSRGKVAIVFSIDRQGSVPKLIIGTESGVRALDLAAVAGVNASTPFPPFPTEFKGGLIRLQLVFAYNMPVN